MNPHGHPLTRWQRITKSANPHLKYIDSDLVEGYEYEYRVMAENKAGLSDPSKPSNRFVCKDPYSESFDTAFMIFLGYTYLIHQDRVFLDAFSHL